MSENYNLIIKNGHCYIDGKLIKKDISISEFYNADEVFTTGTMGELARVKMIDNRKIKNKGKILKSIQSYFRNLTQKEGNILSF